MSREGFDCKSKLLSCLVAHLLSLMPDDFTNQGEGIVLLGVSVFIFFYPRTGNTWVVTADERQKHETAFLSLKPSNGRITGAN